MVVSSAGQWQLLTHTHTDNAHILMKRQEREGITYLRGPMRMTSNRASNKWPNSKTRHRVTQTTGQFSSIEVVHNGRENEEQRGREREREMQVSVKWSTVVSLALVVR